MENLLEVDPKKERKPRAKKDVDVKPRAKKAPVASVASTAPSVASVAPLEVRMEEQIKKAVRKQVKKLTEEPKPKKQLSAAQLASLAHGQARLAEARAKKKSAVSVE